MIEVKKGSLFESGCEAIVNAVNCVGVMGGGLALEFKKRYPKMFVEYRDICNANGLKPGLLHHWKDPETGVWVINFPTKIDWLPASEYSYVDQGLHTLNDLMKTLSLKSIALPALGCGLGNLSFVRVLDLIKTHHELHKWEDINVLVYEPHGAYSHDNFAGIDTGTMQQSTNGGPRIP